MLKKTPAALVLVALVLVALLLTPPPRCAAQSASAQTQADTDAARAADEQKRQSLLADLRALESESKELRAPLDLASAKAEIAAAEWTLDRERAKRLLREALPLTFPEEVDRPKMREHSVGARLQMGPLEDRTRALVRGRILKIASADATFARELADSTARELGVVEEVDQYTQLASAAAGEGRIEEASDLIRHAVETEPTLIGIGFVINEVAAHDRAAADRLMLDYINSLRALPLAVFTDRNDAGLRVPLGFMAMLDPAEPFFDGGHAGTPPPGREVVRAYIGFVMDTMGRAGQSHADVSRMWAMLVTLWPYVAEYAPELISQFNALERASRPARPPRGARARPRSTHSPKWGRLLTRDTRSGRRPRERRKTRPRSRWPPRPRCSATSSRTRARW